MPSSSLLVTLLVASHWNLVPSSPRLVRWLMPSSPRIALWRLGAIVVAAGGGIALELGAIVAEVGPVVDAIVVRPVASHWNLVPAASRQVASRGCLVPTSSRPVVLQVALQSDFRPSHMPSSQARHGCLFTNLGCLFAMFAQLVRNKCKMRLEPKWLQIKQPPRGKTQGRRPS